MHTVVTKCTQDLDCRVIQNFLPVDNTTTIILRGTCLYTSTAHLPAVINTLIDSKYYVNVVNKNKNKADLEIVKLVQPFIIIQELV